MGDELQVNEPRRDGSLRPIVRFRDDLYVHPSRKLLPKLLVLLLGPRLTSAAQVILSSVRRWRHVMFCQGFDAHEKCSNDKRIMNQPLPSDRAACPRINAER